MKKINTKIILPIFLFLCVSGMQARTKKAIYIVMDGIPADYIERVRPKTVFEVAQKGNYSRAITGGETGAYSQTPTISAIGYMNILTGTWMNKHNVNGNSNLNPNYNYWSLFRIAKSQKKEYKTALFSSWIDNRTVLIGEGKPETDYLKIDYVFDGYELDSVKFPPREKELHIFDIDSLVAVQAAECIRKDAPDVSWVYLWYTDSGFHLYGDGSFMDTYVHKTDDLIAPIWEAVQYREKEFNEEWMFIVTTDHGRTESGHGHGGQSERERSVWISTNIKDVNEQFSRASLALTDITPSICSFMDFEVSQDIFFEQDGIPFIGKTDIYELKTRPYDDQVTLTWQCAPSKEDATVYVSHTNNFKEGGKGQWIEIGKVPAEKGEFVVDLKQLPPSKFYKFVVATSNNKIGRWIYK